MKISPKWLTAGCLFVALSPVHAIVINRIVATVDGGPITLYELQGYRLETAQALRGAPPPEPGVLLEALITDKIVQREAESKGIVVSDVELDRYIESVKERNRISDEQLDQALVAQGLTIETYRSQVRKEIQRQHLINREIRGKVNVTPEEIERYYQAHLDDYGQPAGYQVAHIVFDLADNAPSAEAVAVRAKADEVYERLRGGADFAETAARFSEDAGTAADGGVLGWFKPDELVDSLEKVANDLDVGEISRPVPGPKGLHILKVLDRRTMTHKPIEEVQEEIKQNLYAQALESRFRDWLETDLRKDHHVEILQ